jgi:hypothetical protein
MDERKDFGVPIGSDRFEAFSLIGDKVLYQVRAISFSKSS